MTDKIAQPPTTAADLIAMLQKLPPDTHVYVDIAGYDWSHSHRIEVIEADEDYYPDKAGSYYLRGMEDWEV